MTRFEMSKGEDAFTRRPEEIINLNISKGHMNGMKTLFDVARQSNPKSATLPNKENVETYISEELIKQRKLLGKLCIAGLDTEFMDPDFMMGFSATGESADLPVEALLEYMSQEEMLRPIWSTNKSAGVDWFYWLRDFRSIQAIESTGGILLQDKKIQHSGKSLKYMNRQNEEISIATKGKYGAEMLGIILNLQRYVQDPRFRSEELSAEASYSVPGVCTSDRTRTNAVAGFAAFKGKVESHNFYNMDAFFFGGESAVGSVSAVVEK